MPPQCGGTQNDLRFLNNDLRFIVRQYLADCLNRSNFANEINNPSTNQTNNPINIIRMQIQSWLSTVMRGHFSLYETRIFTKIVESVQDVIHQEGGVSLVIGRQISTDGLNRTFEVPIKELMNVGAHRNADVKKALENLKHKEVLFRDEEKKLYKSSWFINNFVFDSLHGKVTISVPEWLLSLILNFKAGASIYNLETALSFRKPATVRLYMLLCNQRNKITYSIKFLREIMGVKDDQYKQTRDFIKRTIEPARLEMDAKGSNSYTYTANKLNADNIISPITSITFTPIKREQQSKESISSKVSLGLLCPTALQQYLTYQCNFTIDDLKKIKPTLYEFSKLDNYLDRIVAINERARKGRKGIGYIINAMRSEAGMKTTTTKG